jgi:hypothetical protein
MLFCWVLSLRPLQFLQDIGGLPNDRMLSHRSCWLLFSILRYQLRVSHLLPELFPFRTAVLDSNFHHVGLQLAMRGRRIRHNSSRHLVPPLGTLSN